jgi:hypothetical protein
MGTKETHEDRGLPFGKKAQKKDAGNTAPWMMHANVLPTSALSP